MGVAGPSFRPAAFAGSDDREHLIYLLGFRLLRLVECLWRCDSFHPDSANRL